MLRRRRRNGSSARLPKLARDLKKRLNPLVRNFEGGRSHAATSTSSGISMVERDDVCAVAPRLAPAAHACDRTLLGPSVGEATLAHTASIGSVEENVARSLMIGSLGR